MRFTGIRMENNNKGKFNIGVDTFYLLRYDIAESYGREFSDAFSEYLKAATDGINVVNMYDSIVKLMDCAYTANVDKDVLAFLTSFDNCKLNGETCTKISERIVKSKVGNEERTNMPSFYKFFRKAGMRDYIVSFEYNLESRTAEEVAADNNAFYSALAGISRTPFSAYYGLDDDEPIDVDEDDDDDEYVELCE